MFESTAWHRILSEENSQSIKSIVGTPSILGAVSLGFCMFFFALAIHFECIEDLAPRAANRPKAVMKNAILHGFSEEHKHKIYLYPFAWIVWAYNLTYKQCIEGIPGTGTRKNGWEGPLLKTNLDAVILLKFHTLLFKIALLVAVLCMFVLIPVNMTAGCDVKTFGIGTCATHESKSGFIQTTISNIPDKIYNNLEYATAEIEISTGQIFDLITGNKNVSKNELNVTILKDTNATGFDEIKSLAPYLWIPDQTWRICVTLVCCLLIYAYTMYLLMLEWIENVKLRRAFFLEASHYGLRMIELNKLDLDFVKKKKRKSGYDHVSERHVFRDDNDALHAHLTHPEIRETPPSIGLYSVLYQLPNCMVTYDTYGATSLERQLVATTRFFDEVVPPQPGFSSSVVAVTMIPKAKLVAKAQRKWKVVEMKLQTLRYIRKLITNAKNKKEGQKQKKSDLLKSFRDEDQIIREHTEPTKPIELDEEERVKTCESSGSDGVTKLYSDDHDGGIETLRFEAENERYANANGMASPPVATMSPRASEFKYEDFDVKVYAKSIGFIEEVDKISDFVDGMGIEEFNVFAYNCALLAGTPGFKNVRKLYSMETLIEEEKNILEELDEAHQELIEARADVVACDNDIPSLGNLEDSGAVLNPNNDNNEWRVSENGFDETLRILESQSDIKPEGKFKNLVGLFKRIFHGPDNLELDPKYYGVEPDNEGKAFVTDIEHPSYAVITFTSRHSAIIARQCLADGGATNNWKQVDDIPIFPLADAPQMMWYPPGFMRPVTPTISYYSKKIRRWIVSVFMIVFTCSYVAIINFVNQYLWDPKVYSTVFGLSESTLDSVMPTLSGLTQVLLFSICPVIFKFLANVEGSSSSMEEAEQRALIYFWYFYFIARFMGQLIWESVVSFTQRDFESVEKVFALAISRLAANTTKVLGPAALTYIIFAGSITWPALYFLQLNNFWTSWFRLGWINRALKGGGPGPEVPYRIYVDSGYVLSCMTALAPVCPLIGPFALLYFIILSPMLRWLMVFAYRPTFDSGGDKWPKLYHIVISSLLLGQLLTMITFLLKGNLIEGLIIGACTIPTLLFNTLILDNFLRPFRDASLRHTGRINRANQAKEEDKDSWQEREEFRRWLVDCHKASYLPTCLSGGTKNLLTAEPTMVVPILKQSDESGPASIDTDTNMRNLFERQTGQKGGIMRRQRFGI